MRKHELNTYKYRGKETSQQSSKQLLSLFDSALILSIITGTGYYLAFSYQKGYKKYYHIDNVLLDDITILNVLIAIGAIIVAALYIFNVFYSLYIFTPNSDHPFMKFFRGSVLPLIFIFIILILLSPEKLNTEILIVGGFIVALPIISLFIVAVFHDEKGYLNKLKRAAVFDEPTFFEKVRIIIKGGNNFHVIVLCMVFFIVLSSAATMLGEKDASEKEMYMVIAGENPLVIIESYKDGIILAPIDLEKKLIIPEFQVIETKSTITSPVKFKSMIFEGGLRVKEPENNIEYNQK